MRFETKESPFIVYWVNERKFHDWQMVLDDLHILDACGMVNCRCFTLTIPDWVRHPIIVNLRDSSNLNSIRIAKIYSISLKLSKCSIIVRLTLFDR